MNNPNGFKIWECKDKEIWFTSYWLLVTGYWGLELAELDVGSPKTVFLLKQLELGI